MSGLFSSCFAAIATLLKKQKPIAFNVMLMMLMMMVVNGDAVDARGDEGDDDFAGDNASGGDEENSELFPHLFCLGMVARGPDKGKPVRELSFEISSGKGGGRVRRPFYHSNKNR